MGTLGVTNATGTPFEGGVSNIESMISHDGPVQGANNMQSI